MKNLTNLFVILLIIIILFIPIAIYQEIRASRNYTLIPDFLVPVIIIGGVILFIIWIYNFVKSVKKKHG